MPHCALPRDVWHHSSLAHEGQNKEVFWMWPLCGWIKPWNVILGLRLTNEQACAAQPQRKGSNSCNATLSGYTVLCCNKTTLKLITTASQTGIPELFLQPSVLPHLPPPFQQLFCGFESAHTKGRCATTLQWQWDKAIYTFPLLLPRLSLGWLLPSKVPFSCPPSDLACFIFPPQSLLSSRQTQTACLCSVSLLHTF